MKALKGAMKVSTTVGKTIGQRVAPSRVVRRVAGSEWGTPDYIKQIKLTGARYAVTVSTPGHGGLVAVAPPDVVERAKRVGLAVVYVVVYGRGDKVRLTPGLSEQARDRAMNWARSAGMECEAVPVLVGEEDCAWAALLWTLGSQAVQDYRQAHPHLSTIEADEWGWRVWGTASRNYPRISPRIVQELAAAS